MTRLFKRILALLLALLLLPLGGCTDPEETPTGTTVPALSFASPGEAVAARNGYHLRAAVLYSGSADSIPLCALLDDLRQSPAVNLQTDAVCADGGFSLEGCDLVYLDESLLQSKDPDAIADRVAAFAEAGGGVFCPNAFCEVFPPDFFGAEEFTRVEGFPSELVFPEVGRDLAPLQELVRDFHTAYKGYVGAADLRGRGYGMGLVPSTAQPIICKYDGTTALYALNRRGRGLVFFANPLLPNRYSASGFDLRREEGQEAFSNTTASFNQLIYSWFASLVSKERYGFSISRVYGAYGSPAMSWELHYEEITGMEHGSILQFADLAEAARQPVSLTVVRDTYYWFRQAETMTYALNTGADGLQFALDRNESAYSSGTHIAAGDTWLQLNALENCSSYFTDLPEENYRLYPCLTDWDGDGLADFFCGSEDGKVYFFRGLGFTGRDGRLCTEPAVEVPGASVSAFSAPQCADLDGDGRKDLLVGASDGTVWLCRGLDGLRFAQPERFLVSGWEGQCLPRLGDVDGDGIPDLVLGSDQGKLRLYPGSWEDGRVRVDADRFTDLSGLCAEAELGSWLSPELCDLDGDGITDLAVGVFRGYIARFRGDGKGGFAFEGFVDVADRNYLGNDHLKFGTYCTPVFADLDGNGSPDLLCGCQEYGMAVPIDSPYFPYAAELQAQLDAARERHWYVGVHYLCGFWFSADREAWELEAHKKALADYGVTGPMGVNQHTWHLSQYDTRQSLDEIWRAGFLWESGFEPSGAMYRAPNSTAENMLVLPFFLTRDGERTLLVQNCSTLLSADPGWSDLMGKYRAPLLAYYHCDFVYRDAQPAKEAIATLDAFREKYSYSFVREDQMMHAIAAASNLTLDAAPAGEGFTLTAGAERTDFPLYDPLWQQACGVEISFAEGVTGFGTDADVGYSEANSLFVGLNRTVTVARDAETPALRLRQLNAPAELLRQDGGLTLRFQDDGYAEVTVEGAARTDSEGWTVTTRNGCTVFSRFGEALQLHILPGE